MAASGETMDGTCEAHTLTMLVTALRTWGVEVTPILAAADLVIGDIEDRERRIALSQYRAVWDAALVATGDEALGLHVMEAFEPSDILATAVYYLASSSATPREAFDRASRFVALSHEAIEVDLSESEGRTICRVGFRGWEDHRTLSEYILCLVVKIAPAVVGEDAPPFKVCFRHPRPSYADEYESILGAKIEFDAPYNALVGDAAELDQPLPNADAILCSLMERQAEAALARLPKVSSFAEVVRLRIEEALPSGEVTADRIARAVGVSPRTLRRRLGECGATYQGLHDGVRCDFARQALAKPGASVSEVAFALGFSDASAFHKAFRRWTGQRPSDMQGENGDEDGVDGVVEGSGEDVDGSV